MGMDVFGRNPSDENGEYFRANVWWWHPLWNYCALVAPDLTEAVNGHVNDGDGLDAGEAEELANRLSHELATGATEVFHREFCEMKASAERSTCTYCGGSGVRRDEVGVNAGMVDQELDPILAVLLGRGVGWCNGCNGEGSVEAFVTRLQFSVRTVEDFVRFLRSSGGFSIH